MKFFSHGILGMNARNLKYIRTMNSRESISLADSKLKTKDFLSSRWIPFAETYATITSQQELMTYPLSSIGTEDFVVKPNKGSGGKWILIVARKGEDYKVQGEIWGEDEMKLHMTDILHGSFSLHGSSDTVVIEELLTPGTDFSMYCQYGLADIRIIVYNYVPVTAMIRMPTADSEGKANLAQWGIGLGLNIANGQVISLFRNKKIHTHTFPEGHEWLRDRVLPFWDEILLLSSQVQMYTKLGYLALDWVITKNGPRLLEINARAGLEIQNVNLVPLASRLRKIEDIKIQTPEKGVEIAKTLFNTETFVVSGKKILSLEQWGVVGDKKILICVDLQRKTSLVSEDLALLVGNSWLRATTDSNVSIALDWFEVSALHEGKIILWTDSLQNYLISPIRGMDKVASVVPGKWTKDIMDLDREVYRIGKKVNLSSLLKPDNYSALLDTFIAHPKGYNPVFQYHFPSAEKIETMRNALDELMGKSRKLQQWGFPIAELYKEKISEIGGKLSLVEAYKHEDFESIARINLELFGPIDPGFLSIAREKVFAMPGDRKKDEAMLGKVLSLDGIIARIHAYFKLHNIESIPISIENGNLSRMSVSYGKQVRIHIAKNAVIREREIDPILAHEIGTHFGRYLAGSETGLKLFQYGTGHYLSDEEGLAIYRSFAHLPEGYEKNAMHIKYYLVATVDTLSFSDTVELLISLYPGKPIESIFAAAVRLKRGITHSWTKGTVGTTYWKDKIYLDGYMHVKQWIEGWGDQDALFYGKIKISDLSLLKNI